MAKESRAIDPEKDSAHQKHVPPSVLPIDRRKVERLPIALPVRYEICRQTNQLTGTSITTNVSGTGIQFYIPSIASPTNACEISLSLPHETTPLCFHGQVSWCRQGHGKYKGQFEVGVMLRDSLLSGDDTFARYCYFIASRLVSKYLR